MVYSVYQWKWIVVIYALGLTRYKFDIWNKVAPKSKFPFGPLELNSWVDPNWFNVDLFMYYT